jgi:RNA polymerase sigma factor (sigma-70 family)
MSKPFVSEGWVRAIACRVAQSRNAWQDLDDLTQEGHATVLEMMPRWNPELGSIEAFTSKRVEGAMREFLDKAHPRQLSDVSLYSFDRADEAKLPDVQIEEHQRKSRLREEYRSLPGPDRELLDDLYGRELTQKTTAARSNVTQSGVWRAHQRVLRTLRNTRIMAAAA